MKQILILFAALAIITGCTSEPAATTETVPQEVVLSGKITNVKKGEVRIASGDFENLCLVNEDGTFSTAFTIEETGVFYFVYGGENTKLYLEPGYELEITLDTEEFDESMSFAGTGAGPNNYLADLYLLNEKLDEENPHRERYLLTPSEYKALEDVKLEKCTEYLHMSHQKLGLPDDFVAQQNISLKYERGISLCDYEASAKYYQEVDEVELPEDWYGFVAELKSEDPLLLENSEFVRFMSTHLRTQTKKEYDDVEEDPSDELAFDRLHLENIDKSITAQEVKDFFLHRSMMDVVRYNGTKNLDEMVALFKAKCQDEECIKAVLDAVAEWAPLKPGQPAPNFTSTDRDGNIVTLADLKGKVLYIDVWATWCGPCLGELPHLTSLEEEMHGRNIEFVKVSIDKDDEAWRTMITDMEMGGTQLLGDAAWKSEICDMYKINSIPRFILIDADGNIVDANAPRPSSGQQIVELMETTLFGDNLAVVE